MSLYTYPSNKLEYLVQVLAKLLDFEKKQIFTPTQLIVGSRGMQHWLSMQLAETRNIAMNLKYDMVNGYILDICYQLTDKTEHKKAYTKEVLTWRVYKLLDDINSEKLQKYYQDSPLKKYQLSAKIAEVFTMYLMYRPHWLEGWENGRQIEETSDSVKVDESWQMALWQKLVADDDNTPYKIQAEAIAKLNKQNLKKLNIPENIYIFGVNTISPKNLNFLFELAEHIDVNILYINPCSEYWGDFKKSSIAAWLGEEDYEQQPLLANLGQQGKEFINSLIETPNKEEFEVFANANKLKNAQQSQLVSLQRNLLELNCQNYAKKIDNSITINSCHSPLREVQILHDKLLDMIKADDTIKPRDILVMCPNIEDYAPYIDSVFSHYGESKKLPCSIADRTLLDSEPLVASFIDLLQLPESNFEVNKILDYLAVPAIQQKFKISNEQLETISYWLKEACIHHGDDGKTFSWSWGLKRLMLGFSMSDSGKIINSQNNEILTVPIIEGSEIAELGGLYELLELLAEYSQELQQERTFEEWQDYLLKMFADVFEITTDEEYIAKKIKDIIAKTVENGKQVVSDEEIDLYTLRYCLISELSEPIINNHFLNGKVTFCSMTPMRNVPFKVVAILGLNSGKFPRRDTAVSFDLMAQLGRKSGDRTKRDDDRYLFLESILSAREYLYLSYLGRSVKTNSEQQSSLILKEFISYLKDHYGWTDENITEYPLHAFSTKCYSDKYRSYDDAWLRLIEQQPQSFYDNEKLSSQSETATPSYQRGIYSSCSHTREDGYLANDYQKDKDSHLRENEIILPESLSIKKLVNIFDNPLKAYANYGLDLRLEDDAKELEDSEPFDVDNLEKHNLKQSLFDKMSEGKATTEVEKLAKLSGKLPESVLTDNELAEQVVNMQKLVTASNVVDLEKRHFEAEIAGMKLDTLCYINDDEITLITSSSFKIKYQFELYLIALLVSLVEKRNITATYHFLKKDSKGVYKEDTFSIEEIDYSVAKERLEHYIASARNIVCQPILVHLSLAQALFENTKKGVKTEKQKQDAWDKVISDDGKDFGTLDKDRYFKLFYSEHPRLNEFEGGDMYADFFEIVNCK